MKTTTAFMITLIVFIIYSVALWETAKTTVMQRIEGGIDTVEVKIPIDDSTGYKPSVIKIKEKVNVDSIFQVAKEYWQSIIKPDTVYKDYAYVASLDSTYEDDLLKADVSLTSRIPIDPEAYFRLKFDVKKEMVFVPTYVKDESFFHNRFIPYIGVGLSYGIDSKIIEPAIQLGLGIRIN